jgi:hypothetical protein
VGTVQHARVRSELEAFIPARPLIHDARAG